MEENDEEWKDNTASSKHYEMEFKWGNESITDEEPDRRPNAAMENASTAETKIRAGDYLYRVNMFAYERAVLIH